MSQKPAIAQGQEPPLDLSQQSIQNSVSSLTCTGAKVLNGGTTLDMNNQKIVNCGVGTDSNDVTSVAVVDSKIANTKVHDLALATATLNMNTQKIENVVNPTTAQGVVTKNYLENDYKPQNLYDNLGSLTFVSGQNNVSINRTLEMGYRQIQEVVDATDTHHVCPKSQVESLISTATARQTVVLGYSGLYANSTAATATYNSIPGVVSSVLRHTALNINSSRNKISCNSSGVITLAQGSRYRLQCQINPRYVTSDTVPVTIFFCKDTTAGQYDVSFPTGSVVLPGGENAPSQNNQTGSTFWQVSNSGIAIINATSSQQTCLAIATNISAYHIGRIVSNNSASD